MPLHSRHSKMPAGILHSGREEMKRVSYLKNLRSASRPPGIELMKTTRLPIAAPSVVTITLIVVIAFRISSSLSAGPMLPCGASVAEGSAVTFVGVGAVVVSFVVVSVDWLVVVSSDVSVVVVEVVVSSVPSEGAGSVGASVVVVGAGSEVAVVVAEVGSDVVVSAARAEVPRAPAATAAPAAETNRVRSFMLEYS